MKIYSSNNVELADVVVSDESYRYRAIMGENALTLTFSMVNFVEIPVGSYADFQGERYTLLKPQNFKKNNTRNFEYTLILESAKSLLGRYKFKDTGSNRLKFSLTAKPQEHLQMLVDNLNQRDAGWTVGDYVESTEKVISYNHTYCDDALRMIAEAFNTEFEVSGKQISIKKVEYNKSNPLPLSYGFGNGFKSGVKRDNYSNSKAIEILYVQGGERNINPSDYGSKELLLPISQTLEYEGRQYVTDAEGLSIQRADKALSSYIEDSKDCSHLYPSRIGTVSSVVIVDAAKNFYDFIDISIPENLDYSKCRIAGEKATIIFQSGMLAGKEFDLEQTDSELSGYVHSERRFKIVPQEIDGVTMPGGAFIPAQNDKYAVFGISLPSAYVCDNATKTGASWDMFLEAVKYLYENEDPRFSFTGELDEIWAKQNWLNIGGKIILGGFISFTDDQFQNDPVLIRITGIKDYINNPYSPQIELSNVTAGGTTSSLIKDIPLTEVVIDTAKKEVIRYAKRGFRDAQQTTKMLQDSLLKYSGSISPISIQTMQLIAGDESLQFVFVANSGSTAAIPHLEAYNPVTKQFSSDSGVLQHKTLGITSISSSHSAAEYKWWAMTAFTSAVLSEKDKSYYLYAKVSKTANTGVFLLSETAIGIESVAGYYHLLMGILNSEFDGDRAYSAMYGYSELTPGRLTTKKIVSPDGQTFVDLDSGVIQGAFKFQSGITVEDDATAKADAAQAAAIAAAADDAQAKADSAVNNLQVGGRNLIKNGNFATSDLSNFGWTNTGQISIDTTKYFKGISSLKGSNIDANSNFMVVYTADKKAGDVFTVSGYAMAEQASQLLVASVKFDWGWNGDISVPLPANEWTKFSFTYTIGDARNFIMLGAPTGVLWLDSVKMEIGNKATDWSPSPEDVKADIDEAKQAASNAQNSATNANNAVGNLNTYVDNSFRDGVIEASEAKAIEKYKNVINESKTAAENEYNNLYVNSYLEGTAKNNLLNAKISLFGAIDNLLSSVNTAILDGKTTVAEKADVDSKYALYITAIGSYKAAVNAAAKSIQVKLDGLSTTKANDAQANSIATAAADASAKVNAVQVGGRNLIKNSVFIDISNPWNRGTIDLFPKLSEPIIGGIPYCITIGIPGLNSMYVYYSDGSESQLYPVNQSVYIFPGGKTVIYLFGYYDTPNYAYNVKFKLEKGNKPTDWTPAPEDVDAKIAETNFLKTAFQGSTKIQGGAVATNVLTMEDTAGTIRGGMSGLADDNVGVWTGGTYDEAIAGLAKNILFKNGSFRLAGGDVVYDINQIALTISALIRTSATGSRVEISKESNSITIYDANNSAKMKIAPKNVMPFSEIGGNVVTETLTYAAHSNEIGGTGTVNIGSTELLVLNVNKYYDITTPAVAYILSAIGYRDGLTKENFTGIATIEVRLVDTIKNTVVWAKSANVSSGTITRATENGTIAPSTIIACPGSTYRIDVYISTSDEGNGSDASAFASINAGQTMTATSLANFSEMGLDGFNFINDATHFLHYGPDIFAYKGALNFPGVLASGSVAASNTHTNKWGAKVATDSQSVTKGGTGVYNVPHNLGSTAFTIISTPTSDNIVCRVSSKSSTYFQITCKNMSSVATDAAFDYIMVGSN